MRKLKLLLVETFAFNYWTLTGHKPTENRDSVEFHLANIPTFLRFWGLPAAWVCWTSGSSIHFSKSSRCRCENSSEITLKRSSRESFCRHALRRVVVFDPGGFGLGKHEGSTSKLGKSHLWILKTSKNHATMNFPQIFWSNHPKSPLFGWSAMIDLLVVSTEKKWPLGIIILRTVFHIKNHWSPHQPNNSWYYSVTYPLMSPRKTNHTIPESNRILQAP